MVLVILLRAIANVQMQKHLRLRNGCRKSITCWYSLSWESLCTWKDEIPEMIEDLENAINSGNPDEIFEMSEMILQVDEVRDSADLKLSHWEIEYADIVVQPLPEDEFEKTSHEIVFTGIGFPFKSEVNEWGTTYEVDELKLFEKETKGKFCILFYTYDSKCSYEHLVETSDPFDPALLSYCIENDQDFYRGFMAYDGNDITENWEGSGEECDGAHAVFVNGNQVIQS